MTDDRESAEDPGFARYARQMRYPGIGAAGQRRLAKSRVLICGCGALGSVSANTLTRAGVGHLRLVDRDFLELNNLQRQVLYDEDDVAAAVPKSIAAAAKLRRINSTINIEPLVLDIDHRTLPALLEDVDLIIDGTDNFETRFLLNDASLRQQIPWVFGGCLGAEGQTLTILPGETPCLRCVLRDTPPPGAMETCDTAGILAPIINVIASIQACEALKILAGQREAVSRVMQVFDLWDNRIRQVKLDGLRDSMTTCPACSRSDFPWWEGGRGSQTAVLCGRNSVQLSFPDQPRHDFSTLAVKLAAVGNVSQNRYLLRLTVDRYTLTLFPDGRAIVGGTSDVAEARSAYARYVGL